jgi:IS605 OrfB family transposase
MTQKEKIRDTVQAYVNAMNYISAFAMENNIWNKVKIQQRIYQDIRDQFQLRSQMTINVIRETTAKYNGQHKKNRTRKDKKDNPKPVQFKSLSMRLNYPRDYSLKDDSIVSINSIYGRLLTEYKIGRYQRNILDSKDWTKKSSVLTIRKDGITFLNIAIERKIEKTTLLMKDGVVGIDLGINFVAVTTDTSGKTDFYGGGTVKYARWLHAKHRMESQSQGTRASKRFLRRIRRRETRFVTENNHIIAKTIVQKATQRFKSPIIAMEDLKGIRQQKYIGKDHRTRLSKWAFYQLQQFIEYKALEQGIPVVYVDPKYTSQMCPKCGFVHKSNRDRKLHMFKCKKCGYTSNDDRINIRDRAVVPRYIRSTRGLCQYPLCSV